MIRNQFGYLAYLRIHNLRIAKLLIPYSLSKQLHTRGEQLHLITKMHCILENIDFIIINLPFCAISISMNTLKKKTIIIHEGLPSNKQNRHFGARGQSSRPLINFKLSNFRRHTLYSNRQLERMFQLITRLKISLGNIHYFNGIYCFQKTKELN